jgi:hypothetical protein
MAQKTGQKGIYKRAGLDGRAGTDSIVPSGLPEKGGADKKDDRSGGSKGVDNDQYG